MTERLTTDNYSYQDGVVKAVTEGCIEGKGYRENLSSNKSNNI